MSRYPTTADLAALRLTFERAADPFPHDNCPAYSVPPHGGAWPDELRDGIGWRRSAFAPNDRASRHEYAARRGAAALRSRAYARACVAASPGPCADCGAIGWHTRACRADWPALP